MKATDGRASRKGIGGLWLLVAAAAGAVTAYLGDPERGKLRREATVGRLRSAVEAARERGVTLQRRVSTQISRQPSGTTSVELPITGPSKKPAASSTPSPNQAKEEQR